MRWAALALGVSMAAGADWRVAGVERLRHPVRGAAFVEGRLLTWGQDSPARGSFQRGGCAGDVDGDGRADLILHERAGAAELGEMVWLRAPRWVRERIDTEASFEDCLWTKLDGQWGALVVHRQAQLRFYTRADGRWTYREIYSIYTPSAQGGLARADVDGDGREDLYCGNYWLRAPESEDGHWRLFAIGSWWEGERSAMLRVALAGPGRIVAAEREASPARVAWFERPEDPKQFWKETRLTADPPLRNVRGLVVDGDAVIAAEDAGPGSRVVLFERGSAREIGRTGGLFGLWLDRGVLVGVGEREVVRWRRN